MSPARKKNPADLKQPQKRKKKYKHVIPKALNLETGFGILQMSGDHYWLMCAWKLHQAGKDDFVPKSRRGLKKKWEAPEHMPRWQAFCVANGLMCGAKSKMYLDGDKRLVRDYLNTDEEPEKCVQMYCRQSPPEDLLNTDVLKPWRCYFHQGASQLRGAAHKQRMRDAFWSSALMPQEVAQFTEIAADDPVEALDHDIAVCKMRLKRALAGETAQLRMTTKEREKSLVLVSTTERQGSTEEGTYTNIEEKREVIDWDRKIDNLVSQMCRLIRLRADARGDTSSLDPAGVAARVRAMVAKSREIHSDEEAA